MLTGVTGTHRTAPAARGLPARLLAVVVVLAGLLVLSGSQCVAEMTAGAHPAPGASPATMHDNGQAAGTAMRLEPGPAEPLAGSAPGPGDLGGALALCLALLLAVLAAITGVLRRWQRLPTRRPPRRGTRLGAFPRPVPDLAHLCVLRV